jgi:hypothetical protein
MITKLTKQPVTIVVQKNVFYFFMQTLRVIPKTIRLSASFCTALVEYYLFNPRFCKIFLITMFTCDERIWVIENYRTLGGVTACVNDWPFESAAPNKSTDSRLSSRFELTGSVMNHFFNKTGLPHTLQMS